MPAQPAVGLDNASLNGRVRQAPVQAAPPPPPSPPMEGGTMTSWTTPPAPGQVVQPTVEAPLPIWAQTPAGFEPLASTPAADPIPPPAPAIPTPTPIPSSPEPAPAPNPELAPVPPPAPDPAPPPVIEPQPFATPAQPRLQSSRVLRRQFGAQQARQAVAKLDPRKQSVGHLVVGGLAVFIFLIGVVVSLQTVQSNHDAVAEVLAAAGTSKLGDNVQSAGQTAASGTANSAGRPDAKAFAEYNVASEMPRYIEIPKLGIVARVAQAGINDKGALGVPDNPYDAAWYANSTKPGQPGIGLIDGLVSSASGPGVFRNLDQLVPGDLIQIIKGDGSTLNYHVVKSATYVTSQLSMQTALGPATSGHSGVNLLSMPSSAAGAAAQSVLVNAE